MNPKCIIISIVLKVSCLLKSLKYGKYIIHLPMQFPFLLLLVLLYDPNF